MRRFRSEGFVAKVLERRFAVGQGFARFRDAKVSEGSRRFWSDGLGRFIRLSQPQFMFCDVWALC